MKLSIKLNNDLVFKTLIFVLAFVVLYPKFPLFRVSGTFVAIRLEDVLIALLLLLWTTVNIRNLKKILNLVISKSLLLYWIIGLVSLFSAIFITSSISPNIGFLHWLRRVEMMSLFLVAATTLSRKDQLIWVLKFFSVVLVLVIVYGFGQVYLKFPVISTTNSEFSKGQILTLTPDARVHSTFGGHYDLAVFLSFAVLLLVAFVFFVKKFKDKVLLGTVGVLSFVLLGMTAARVSFAATLAAVGLLLFATGKKLLIVGLIVVAVLVVGLLPELRHRLVATITVNILQGGGPKYEPPPAEVNIFTPDNSVDFEAKRDSFEEATMSQTPRQSTISADIAAGEPINTTELGVDRSFKIRFMVEWPRAIRGFIKNPFLGTGYSSLGVATDNDLLRSLGEVGIIGTISLCLIFVLIGKRFITKIRHSDSFEKYFLICGLCIILITGVTSTFIDLLESSKVAAVLWTILGLGWAVSSNYRVEES